MLENAVDVVEYDRLNNVSEIVFSLPAVDDKNRFCSPFHYVRWEDGALYRILDHTSTRDGGTDLVAYSCEHVIATLIDTVIFGTLQLDNLPTRTVLERILSRQSEKHWRLGDVEFDRRFSYSWSNENLLAALFSIPNRFDEAYQWVFDTAVYPWTVHLRRLDERIDPQFYIREGRNLLASSVTSKGRDICNRIYPLGYGEGVNQLTIREVTGGAPYVEDAGSIARYGLKERIWEDNRFEIPQALYDRARVLLRGYAQPYESWDVTAADLETLTGQEIDRAAPGKIAQFGSLKTYIVEVERHLQSEGEDRLTLANAPEDVAGTIADLADRQRITSVYANGATNIYAQSFQDNADQTHPAVIRFYIPAEARQINKIPLTWTFERFRAYNTGAQSTESTTRSTKGGGGSKRTSSTSGGSVETSGPSSERTTGDPSAPGALIYQETGSQRGEGSGHFHLYSYVGVADHTHDMDHTHKFEIPDHNHGIELPEHAHDFTVPGHTHAPLYGIHQGPRVARALLRVDGSNVPLTSGQSEVDIVPWLSVDGSGKIRRGTYHTIEIIPQPEAGNPAGLTRIFATLTVQIFIQSTGGGNY